MKKVLWVLLTGYCIYIAPTLFALADLERGFDATGGEMFIFLIPALAWLFFSGDGLENPSSNNEK